jgi:single-strand DNA-binding protein
MTQPRLPYLNKVIMIGTLIRDPELRYTTANIPVTNFRIASNKRYRDNGGSVRDDVCYVGIVAWQRLAEKCVAQLKKGQAILVEGELKSRVRNDSDGGRRNYVEIRAHHIEFLGHREPSSGAEESGDSIMDTICDENELEHTEETSMSSTVGLDESGHNNYDFEENTL